jgi:hypothetical protein
MSKATNQDFSAKIIVLFLSGGLVSGVLTVWMSYIAYLGWAFWPGTGLVFWGFLLFAGAAGRSIGWIRFEAPLTRRLLSGLVVAGAFPVAFLIMLECAFLYNELYRQLFPVQWQGRSTSPADEGILIGLIVAAIISAVLVSLAVRLLVQRWISRGFWLMLLAGVFAVPVSIAASQLFSKTQARPVGWDSILLIVGETFFGGACGYWLMRVSSGDQQEGWPTELMTTRGW